jgi:hypothetical protein
MPTVKFDLTLKQIYDTARLDRQATAAAKKGKPGMIIAQILVPDMIVVAEFVDHEKAKKIIEAMK